MLRRFSYLWLLLAMSSVGAAGSGHVHEQALDKTKHHSFKSSGKQTAPITVDLLVADEKNVGETFDATIVYRSQGMIKDLSLQVHCSEFLNCQAAHRVAVSLLSSGEVYEQTLPVKANQEGRHSINVTMQGVFNGQPMLKTVVLDVVVGKVVDEQANGAKAFVTPEGERIIRMPAAP